MAYMKHLWQCDEIITAGKLNHMEAGIAEASEASGGSCDADTIKIQVPRGIGVQALKLALQKSNVTLEPNYSTQLSFKGGLANKQILAACPTTIFIASQAETALIGSFFMTTGEEEVSLSVTVRNVGAESIGITSTNTHASAVVFYVDTDNVTDYYVLKGEDPVE